MENIITLLIVLAIGFWLLASMANSSTQNYCHCLREPRGDDDEGDLEL